MAKAWTKRKVTVVSIIGAILLLIMCAVCFYYFGASYDLYKYVKIEAATPGLADGFVPQGLCLVDGKDAYLVSGYMSDASLDSRIYYVNKQTGESKYITMHSGGTERSKGHFGGIATTGKFVWLVSDGVLYSFEMTSILLAQNADMIMPHTILNMDIATDFCYASDSQLFVGEFYRAGNYEVDETHYLTSSAGQTNHAIMAVYDINENNINGLQSTIPVKVISIPDQVQGFCITDAGTYVFSTSFSLPDSIIYMFNQPVETSKYVEIGENSIPVYALFNEQLKEKVVAPCMSEGIDYANGSVHIVFENACSKYKLVTRVRERNILSFEVE
jgi:hypothetical protein